MIGQIAAGAVAGELMRMVRERADRRQQRDLAPLRACQFAIVIVGVDDSVTARMIDRATGNLGFSHVYLDPCRRDRFGRRMVIDYTRRKGVHWTPAAKYARRRRVIVNLDIATGSEIYGCVRARLGRSMRTSDLVLGRESMGTCVGLIASCLPWWLQRNLRAVQVGPCISPNTLAAYFGGARRDAVL